MDDKVNTDKYLGDWLDAYKNMLDKDETNEVTGKPFRPKRKYGYDEVKIRPVANGYMVNADGDTFVFKDLDEFNNWLKEKMSPTEEQKKFLEAL